MDENARGLGERTALKEGNKIGENKRGEEHPGAGVEFQTKVARRANKEERRSGGKAQGQKVQRKTKN